MGKTKELYGLEIPARLPVPKRGVKLSDSDKVKLAGWICQVYALNECSLRETLLYFKLANTSVWYKWMQENPTIRKMYKDATESRDYSYMHNITNKAKTSLEKALEGQIIELKKKTEHSPKPGQGKLSILSEITTTEKYIAPNPYLIQFALTNGDGANFQRNPNPVSTEDKHVNIPIVQWVK